MSTTTEAPVLEIRRILDATPKRVFDAWLGHAQFQAWIGPEGVTCEVPLHEPRVGGRYRIIMHLSDGRVIPATVSCRSGATGVSLRSVLGGNVRRAARSLACVGACGVLFLSLT